MKSNSVAPRRQAASDQQTIMRTAPDWNQDMSFQSRRAQRLGGASLLLLGAAATPAFAQTPPQDKSSTEIPAVTVTAPSPIVRRAVVPSRNPGRGTRTARVRNREQAAEATPATAAPAIPQQGVLPVVTNQFATVTVVPNEEIRRPRGGSPRSAPP